MLDLSSSPGGSRRALPRVPGAATAFGTAAARAVGYLYDTNFQGRTRPTPLKALAEHGQSVWIDYLSRRFVRDGDLAGLIDDGLVGVTSNLAVFQAAIAEGDAYDEQLREVMKTGRKQPRSRVACAQAPATLVGGAAGLREQVLSRRRRCWCWAGLRRARRLT